MSVAAAPLFNLFLLAIFSQFAKESYCVITLGCNPYNVNGTDYDCPKYSKCVKACPVGLDEEYVCRCDEQQYFYKDRMSKKFRCYTIVSVGEKCDHNTYRCPLFASCRNGQCRCNTPYIVTDDGRHCKPEPFIRPMPKKFSVLNEFCDEENQREPTICINHGEMVCRDHTCVCRPGNRPATRRELIRNGNAVFYCMPDNMRDIANFFGGNGK